MSQRVWRLTIEKENGNLPQICGSEEAMRSELNAWVEHENSSADEWLQHEESGQTYRNIEASKVRQVDGFMDDAARSPVVLAYRFIDVLGMFLLEM